MSSSIPSWHILTAHAQPFRKARDLVFCLKVPLDSLLVWASSEGSGETARMRRLAWTFAARIGHKYQIRLTRSIYHSWTEKKQKGIGTVFLVCCYCVGQQRYNAYHTYQYLGTLNTYDQFFIKETSVFCQGNCIQSYSYTLNISFRMDKRKKNSKS